MSISETDTIRETQKTTRTPRWLGVQLPDLSSTITNHCSDT